MGKFNTVRTRPAVASPVTTSSVRSQVNHEHAAGYRLDTKSELFLLAVSNMVGQPTFYETGSTRDDRYERLVRAATAEDPQWTAEFLRWLRTDGNMRSASLVGAAAFAADRALRQEPGMSRQVIDSVLQRADEPGEMLAYWTSVYGRAVPKPVKRGVADAVARLYNERSLVKYDTDSKGFRFGDVIELVHPSPSAPWQGELFRHALDRRHNRDNPIPETLAVLVNRQVLMSLPVEQRRAVLTSRTQALAAAGMTWEAVAGWLQGPMDRAAWEAVIPSMGYMALLRNLRNFDQAGVSDAVAERVAARLADPEQVARSRQFPFRFYAAHTAVGSLRWGHALEKALAASLCNVPALPGRTLVLVDQSPSMFPGYYFSTRATSDITNADQAKLFGAAVALRAADATLVGYGRDSREVPFAKGDAVLAVMGRFTMIDGTDTFGAIHRHYAGHDRVIIITDEQNQAYRFSSIDEVLPKHIPAYTWNIAGYGVAATQSGRGTRHTFGGLTDAAFRMVPLLEAGRNADWKSIFGSSMLPYGQTKETLATLSR